MLKRLCLVIILLITLIPPPVPVLAQSPALICEAPHAVYYLPFVPNGGVPVPKSDLLKRIDESVAGQRLTDVDVYDPTETSAPNTPEGVGVTSVVDGISIKVDFLRDTAHLHPRFRNFNVYAQPINSEVEDDGGYLVGQFSDDDWLWHPSEGGYVGWLIALSAVSNTGYESDKSDWQACVISTFYDNFSTYGGDEISDTESLYWLQVATFDTDENWVKYGYGIVSDETANVKQGTAKKVTGELLPPTYYVADARLSKAIDLSVEQRFGDDDYLAISLYKTGVDQRIIVRFWDGSSNDRGLDVSATLNAWNYIKVRKQDLTGESSDFNWDDVILIEILNDFESDTDPMYWIADDLRIVKADPDDAGTFNDTGTAWNFSAGTWHVYAEYYASTRGGGLGPASYSLGQIDSSLADDYFAVAQNVALTNGVVSARVSPVGSDARLGILFRVEDDTLGSEEALSVEVDSSADMLYLSRYSAGVRSTLASTSYDAAPGDAIWLAADFRDAGNEGRVKVYAAQSQYDLLTAPALKISHATAASWPAGYGVGVVTHAANSRFAEFRAGSPQVADYAHQAGHALTAGYSVGAPGNLAAAFLALPMLRGLWVSSVSGGTAPAAAGDWLDLSGLGKTLSYNGNPTYGFDADRLVGYWAYDGVGDYHSRADEADLDILGTESYVAAAVRGLTLYVWCYPTTTNNEFVVGKANDANGPYFLYNETGVNAMFRVRDAADANNYSVRTPITLNAWQLIAGRYRPSTEIKIWDNSVANTNVVGIPASILNGGDSFAVAGNGGGTGLFTGRVAAVALYAAAHSDAMVSSIWAQQHALFGV